jgi:hypothetical protein
MPYKVERLPHEPIIVASWFDPVDPVQDSVKMAAETDALIGPSETKVFVVNDFRPLKVDLKFVIAGMSAQRLKRPGAGSDPRIRTILVGEGMFWTIAEKSIKRLQGNLDATLFTSMDEALVHAREKIKSW